MFYTETICPDTGGKSNLLLLYGGKFRETQHSNFYGPLVIMTKRKRGEHFGGVEASLCRISSIMQRAIPERTCPGAWHRFILLRGWGASAAREQAPGAAICCCIWPSLVLFLVFSPGLAWWEVFLPCLPLEGLAWDTEEEQAAVLAAAVCLAFCGLCFWANSMRAAYECKIKVISL